jgi:hypothetical protein
MSVYTHCLKVLIHIPLAISLFYTTNASANTFQIPDNITIHSEKAWEIYAIRMSNPEFQRDFEMRMADAIGDTWGAYLNDFASIFQYPDPLERQARIDFLNSRRHSHFGSAIIPYPDLDIERHNIRGVSNFSAETTTEKYWPANDSVVQHEPYEILPDYAVIAPCYPGSIVPCPKDHEGYEKWQEFLARVEAGEIKTVADLMRAQAEYNGVEPDELALSWYQGTPISEEFLTRHENNPYVETPVTNNIHASNDTYAPNDIYVTKDEKVNTSDLSDIRAPLAAAAVENTADLTEWSAPLVTSERADFPPQLSSTSFAASSSDPIATPEPMTMSLLASGLLGAALRKRRQQI